MDFLTQRIIKKHYKPKPVSTDKKAEKSPSSNENGAKIIHKYNYVLGKGTNVTTTTVLQRQKNGKYDTVRQKSKYETLLSIVRHRLYTLMENSTKEAKPRNRLV